MRNFGFIMILTAISTTPLLAEVADQVTDPIEQVGYVEEEDDVANADSRARDDINFYDKNRQQVRERRQREAMRAYRAAQVQQPRCEGRECPTHWEEQQREPSSQ